MKASLWNPTTNPYELKLLGKLAEEASELACASSRCIIQGIDESEPVTHKLNKEWLEDEIADVMACIAATMAGFELDEDRIEKRIHTKSEYHQPWYDYAV